VDFLPQLRVLLLEDHDPFLLRCHPCFQLGDQGMQICVAGQLHLSDAFK
jgi:hypothetical protein